MVFGLVSPLNHLNNNRSNQALAMSKPICVKTPEVWRACSDGRW